MSMNVVGRVMYKAGDVIPVNKLDEMSRYALPGLFHEGTAASNVSKYVKFKEGDFNPTSLEHMEAAMARHKAIALFTLA